MAVVQVGPNFSFITSSCSFLAFGREGGDSEPGWQDGGGGLSVYTLWSCGGGHAAPLVGRFHGAQGPAWPPRGGQRPPHQGPPRCPMPTASGGGPRDAPATLVPLTQTQDQASLKRRTRWAWSQVQAVTPLSCSQAAHEVRGRMRLGPRGSLASSKVWGLLTASAPETLASGYCVHRAQTAPSPRPSR